MGYQALLLIHILAGMAWVGGAFVLVLTLWFARRSYPPQDVDRLMQDLRWADTWLAIPAPLLVLVTGVAMVLDSRAWNLTQAWVLGSIVLVVAYELVALTLGGRLYRRIERARAQAELASGDHARTMTAFVRLGFVLLMLLVITVWSMVYKPGL
jgi:uncharacterized membrane protein